MTSPMLGQLTLADRVADEETAVKAGTAGCGVIDPGCHGGLTCIRTQHHEDAPHVGRTAAIEGNPYGGGLVQWMPPCPLAVAP